MELSQQLGFAFIWGRQWKRTLRLPLVVNRWPQTAHEGLSRVWDQRWPCKELSGPKPATGLALVPVEGGLVFGFDIHQGHPPGWLPDPFLAWSTATVEKGPWKSWAPGAGGIKAPGRRFRGPLDASGLRAKGTSPRVRALVVEGMFA